MIIPTETFDATAATILNSQNSDTLGATKVGIGIPEMAVLLMILGVIVALVVRSAQKRST